jgi:SAM-dependent methyltransferase
VRIFAERNAPQIDLLDNAGRGRKTRRSRGEESATGTLSALGLIMDQDIDWRAGYVTELEYTYGYYRELSPTLLLLACLSAGIAPPSTKRLNYLEFGYGQGLSINIHAAALDGEFWGTDFNPTQVAHARALRDASGSGAKLFEDSFADFAVRTDLPDFDIIGLHGVWTWISDENGRIIVDIIRRKLRAGGILYISYNCLPGLAPSMPLRHLVKLHTNFAAEATGMQAKLNAALAFAQQVVDSGAFYFRGNPAVAERLKKMSEEDRSYLAHEYFNRDWRVMAFSDVARWLDDAKLTFVASAHLLDHVEALNLSESGHKFLSGISQPVLRQSVRDYFVNQQFRRDVFAKGARKLSPLEQLEAFRQQTFVLAMHADDVPMKVIGTLGEVTLSEQVHRPIIQTLADDGYAPKPMEQIAAHPKLSSLPLPQVTQALIVLAGAGYIYPAQEPASQGKARCAALNRYICERARSSANLSFLASPVCASGVSVSRFQQLFLSAGQCGRKSPKDQAQFVWDLLAAQGQRIIKDGKTLESAEQNLDEMLKQATNFADKRLPVLKGLGVSLQ